MTDTYRINIDERWTLEDLYVFSRTYEQVYFLTYSLFPDLPAAAIERVARAYQAFPWKGGYSAVNFYNQLKYSVPPTNRPKIVAIQYASPGFIELALLVAVSAAISRTVRYVSGAVREMNATYNEIMTDLQKRKLLRLEVKQKELELSKEEYAVIEERAEQMAKLLGFEGHAQLTERTGHPFITLKILLSYYRRLRKLTEFRSKGKADI